MRQTDAALSDLCVNCPEDECVAPAMVIDEARLASTDGLIRHARVRCADGHWFLLPADRLQESSAVRSRASSVVS